MAVRCPHCAHAITVRTAKPGRYTPKCPKCRRLFALTVPSDTSGEWLATSLPETNIETTSASSPEHAVKPGSPSDATEATGGLEPPPSIPQSIDRTAPAAQKTRADVEQTAGGNLEEERPSSTKASRSEEALPQKLGGYEIVKELGRGGMGAVYLARQVSLDRSVALKVMNAKWAGDPIFLARFTREAYAAAQLVHHNVVQIYDFGEQSGVHFFSMEFVEGTSLGDLLKKSGKIDPDTAAGYILQAARGLKFAHDRGMIHRDVKPDNLMLNRLGIVKVADLGLVKTPTMTRAEDAPAHPVPTSSLNATSGKLSGLSSLPTEMTHHGTAMGSPAYMSPEQCRDTSSVDHRADVYSLGCAFYALLSGKPPFTGATAHEVMLKHAFESPTPIEQVEAAITHEISAVCNRMLAKDVADRYQSMDEVIAAVEACLGQFAGGKFTPTQEHLQTLEDCVGRFNSAPMVPVRTWCIRSFGSACLLGVAIGLFTHLSTAAACFGTFFHAALAYFVIAGVRRRTPLFRSVREVALGSRGIDGLLVLFAGVLFLALIYMTGLLWVWLGSAAAGVLSALILQALIDRKLDAEREPAVEAAQRMFQRMRLLGFEETALREFVAKYSGSHWEEFFETLFGLEAKLSLRPLVEANARSVRFGAWREPILRRLETVRNARREAKERRFLQAIEAKKLEAEGLDRRQAQEQAEAVAEKMVVAAAEIKAADLPEARKVDRAQVSPRPKVNVREIIADAEKPAKKLPKAPARPFKTMFEFALSWKPRLILAAILLTLSVLWVKQNLARITDLENIDLERSFEGELTTSAGAKRTADRAIGLYTAIVESPHRWLPLKLPFGLQDLGDTFFATANPLAAGLILLTSLFFRGIAVQLCFWLSAAFCFMGHLFAIPIENVGPLQRHHLTMLAGVILSIMGIVFLRKKQE